METMSVDDCIRFTMHRRVFCKSGFCESWVTIFLPQDFCWTSAIECVDLWPHVRERQHFQTRQCLDLFVFGLNLRLRRRNFDLLFLLRVWALFLLHFAWRSISLVLLPSSSSLLHLRVGHVPAIMLIIFAKLLMVIIIVVSSSTSGVWSLTALGSLLVSLRCMMATLVVIALIIAVTTILIATTASMVLLSSSSLPSTLIHLIFQKAKIIFKFEKFL